MSPPAGATRMVPAAAATSVAGAAFGLLPPSVKPDHSRSSSTDASSTSSSSASSGGPGRARKKVVAREKKARGWGPYKSVLKERSVDFNLTLDVQQLRQEIHELTTLRGLLQAQALSQRHERTEVLVATVREYYRLFRHGYWLDPSLSAGGSRHAPDRARERWPVRPNAVQREFLERVMDDRVDLGCGFSGIDLLLEQMVLYSTCLHEMRVDMRRLDVVKASDLVTITTHADFHFRVAREMVQLVFPHVAGNAALVSRIVGRRVLSDMCITFSFSAGGAAAAGDGARKSCVRFTMDVAFVAIFAELLRDLRATELLLRRARITPNSMLAVDPAECAAGH